MRRVTILGCTLIAGVILCSFQQATSPQDRKTKQKSADTGQRKANGNANDAKNSPSSTTNTDDKRNWKEGDNNQYVSIVTPEKTVDPIGRTISIVGVVCTVILTGVGIFGIRIGLKTLRGILIQAKQTARSARASEKQATALINSERAWLIVEILPVCRMFGNEWHRPAGSGWASLSENEIIRGYHLRHTMKLTNMGRTPAQILRFQIGYSHLPQGVTELPEGSIGDLVEAREFDHALGGAESIEVQEPIIDVFNNQGSTAEQVRAVHEHRATLVVHGWVEYQHVFDWNNTERVDFCYSYSPETRRLNKVACPKQQRTGQNPN